MKQKGLLLLQLGTPDEPTTSACRRYLREFLSDARVVDINPFLRWLLVNAVIVPFRSPKSAHAYQQIWTDRGSPLRFHSEDLRSELAKNFGKDVPVFLGMRYGNPSIDEAIKAIGDSSITDLYVVPLYPQYASSSTGTALADLFSKLSKVNNIPSVQVIGPFYNEEFFIKAWVDRIQSFSPNQYDHILLSYHSLPERHLKASDPSKKHCLVQQNCCAVSVPENRFCYRHHATVTTEKIVSALGISKEKTSMSFQSRLGRTPWLKPYTDHVLDELALRGVKKLLVVSPSFVSDCLETLEELQIRGREQFIAAGGSDLKLVTSLNTEKSWVDGLSSFLQKKLEL